MYHINHPVNDPALVSYHRPELIRLLPDLELARDCWMGLNDASSYDGETKKKYLAQEPGEPSAAYADRLFRSTYTPVYRDAIRGYAGLLGRFELIDVPTTLEDNKHNVDLRGSDIQAFYGRCDEKVLRDGGTYIMVDMLPEEGTTNYLDQQRDGRVPYLVQIDRSDVINWHVETMGGRQRVVHATVRQYRPVRTANSFGSTVEAVYHVLEPNKVTTYTLRKADAGRWENVVLDTIETTVPFVPLVWYGATDTNFAVSEMPMQGLASLSIQHFQMRSDLNELLHKCAMPVPVRKGAIAGANGKMPPLILGPNTAVDLDVEGDFKFAEPTGKSLEQHANELRHVEELMDRSSLNFLYGASVKTATEASLRAAQVSAQVSAMIRTKISSFDTVMRLWALFSGEAEQIAPEAGMSLNDSLINKPVDPSGIAQLVNLYNNGLISRQTCLEELRRGGVLDPQLNIKEEEERVNEDKDRKLDETIQRNEALADSQASVAPTEGTVQKQQADMQKAAANAQKDKQGTTSAAKQ